jgi:hypothetical protein
MTQGRITAPFTARSTAAEVVAGSDRPRQPPYLNISGSYRIPEGSRGYEGGSNWVHSHH